MNDKECSEDVQECSDEDKECSEDVRECSDEDAMNDKEDKE